MLFCLSILSSVGCLSPPGERLGESRSRDDDLVIVTGTTWQLSDFPLRVCFQSTGDGSSIERQAVRDAVESRWASIPGSAISFTGWGTCADDNSDGDIRMFLDRSINRAFSPYGTDNRTAGQRIIFRTPESERNDSLTHSYAHEFGHALGIQHEQAHPDKAIEDPDCASIETLLPTSVAATAYDPDGIMNYCPGHLTQLSPLEVLFTRMVYPSGLLPIACGHCFLGDPILLRTDGFLENTFTAQGAYPWWSGSVHWAKGGLPFSNGPEVSAASIGPTPATISYSGTVSYTGNFVASVSPTVAVSNSRWTAIAMTIL